jgi:gamma-glutamyltranspeptidase/glutathione hydrolase
MRRVLKIGGVLLLALVAALGALGWYVSSLPWRNRCGEPPAPTVAGKQAVATSQPAATRAAAAVLGEGGSAVDAAIAAALALSVVEPGNSGLGGGGFALIYDPKTRQASSLDFREMAPRGLDVAALEAAARRSPSMLRDGALSVAVPTEWAGLKMLHERFGRLPLSRLARPAIALARDGVSLGTEQVARCWVRTGALRADPEARRIFLNSIGLCPLSGAILHQPELAETLRRLTDDAHAESWNDVVGARMIALLKSHGSSMTMADLDGVRPAWRPVVSGSFLGRRVVSMGPPSSGGLVVIEMLQSYQRMRQRLPHANRLHLWVEAARLAFFDRAMRLGDPDFTSAPIERLASGDYAAEQAARVDERSDLPLAAPADVRSESQHTTHVSIIDRDGLAIAMTFTINIPFGSGLVVPGTGVLLNDEMDDFYVAGPNSFGLIGNDKNAPAPGKRPLSSMAPTMVFDGDRPTIVLGSPGGSSIPTAVAWVIRELVEDGRDGDAALRAPRVHHQWFPDKLEVEPGFPRDNLPEPLRRSARRPMFPVGRVQMLLRGSGDDWRALSDCRDSGEAWSGQ